MKQSMRYKKNLGYLFTLFLLILGCGPEIETTEVKQENITEAVYASGVIKSKNQYKVYSGINGLVESILVKEGDSVKEGEILFLLRSEASQINTRNAELTKEYAKANLNGDKLEELHNQVQMAQNIMLLDSANASRQKKIWQQEIGTKTELEQKELAYKNACIAYEAALARYEDYKKQLQFQAEQSRTNWEFNVNQLEEHQIRAKQTGRIYGIYIRKGEWAGLQKELALIGDAQQFLIELQVDENDITKIQKGQKLFLTMDSYKNQVFEAVVTKINPEMNDRSRTFEIEAEFIQPPSVLYPNLTAEANILIAIKENAITIPRSYLVDEAFVLGKDAERIKVRTGLKDLEKVEILEGLKPGETIRKP
jgi:HlyD family secretion protein